MKLANVAEKLATEKQQFTIVSSKSNHNRAKIAAKLNKVHNILDTTSIKVRLTVVIAAVAAIGLGGLAAGTSIRMQHILISTHKENMKYIADRFPMDVEIYSEMIPLKEGARRAIDSLSTENKLIWIKNSAGEITAKSQALNKEEIGSILLTVKDVPLIPQVQDLKGSYWLMCATPLRVRNANLGQLYLAHNITEDQMMFLNLIRSLSIATVIAIIVMTTMIALYIHHSMQPLKKISQLTATISADKLDQAHIHLDQAPSEVKELAETFDKMLIRLAEAWEHQRELLSNVSHELRTPLTIISGYIQSILRRGTNLSEMQKEALTTAASEADRTVQLLQDLLDLARVDSGRMKFQQEKIILNDLIQEVVGMAKQYSDRTITWKSASSFITIKADSHRLKQVLLNLIDNAVKYSETRTPIKLKLEQRKNFAIIQVCDRGVGISLQQQGRIFERFFRVDESRNRAGGTGLGLSIVKTLVEGMGGNISVTSQLNEGSTFTIVFPLV
ncbi:cell wall metabolism sensor histidine kinase WalK [Pleurocapsa sp. PCC 7319]|uniref:sensor histidine kinase n=1 Tax=Pleurocapsa sp. PCC 7319 TaxID=118161 RepID=UPI00034C6880|nr:HAMP domain-containing sensor histidine kinase [Pleurocapsa sp. PCC 7319]